MRADAERAVADEIESSEAARAASASAHRKTAVALGAARVEADLAHRRASRLSVAADAQSLRQVEGELAASRALVKQRDVELASERATSAGLRRRHVELEAKLAARDARLGSIRVPKRPSGKGSETGLPWGDAECELFFKFLVGGCPPASIPELVKSTVLYAVPYASEEGLELPNEGFMRELRPRLEATRKAEAAIAIGKTDRLISGAADATPESQVGSPVDLMPRPVSRA